MSFNNSQKKAIYHFQGPALVLAGPGSGKTTVITHRTKYLIEHYHVEPGHILVITFTRASALEMKERFMKLMDGRKTAVTFGTFHSIFFHILKYAYHYRAENIAREEQRQLFVREILQSLHLEMEDENEFINDILSEIGVVKNDRIALEHYYPKNCSEENFKIIYEQYEQRMKMANLIDFDDMLLMTYELLAARPDILGLWQEKYQFILIDEFQDINKVQYDIVKMLAAPQNNLFIVGDDDQSIYRFRGARPEIMLGFEKDYPTAKQILLDINYRSTKSIVSAAGRLILHNKTRFQKQIRASHPVGVSIYIRHCQSIQEETTAILEQIHAYCDQGIPYSEMAVLVRTNTGARAIVEKMIEANLPFQMRDQIPNLFEHWITRDVLTYMEIAAGDNSRAAFLKIINRPKRYIHREALSEPEITMDLLRGYYRDKDWMIDRVDRLEYECKMLRMMAPYAAINFIRKGIDYESFIREYAKYRKMKPDELMEVLDALQESAKEYKTLKEWKQHILNYTEELKQKASNQQEKRDAVQISTMHSAKGLEYQAVFLPDVNESIVPHTKAVLDADLEEERRLFYVAMTRAKEYLHIYSLKERYNKLLQPSRYLEELLETPGKKEKNNRHKRFG